MFIHVSLLRSSGAVDGQKDGEVVPDHNIAAAIDDDGSRVGCGDRPRYKIGRAFTQGILEYLTAFDRDEIGPQQPLQPAMFEFVRQQIPHFGLEIMFKREPLKREHRTVRLEPCVDLGFGPLPDLAVVIAAALPLIAGVEGAFAVDPDFRWLGVGLLRQFGIVIDTAHLDFHRVLHPCPTIQDTRRARPFLPGDRSGCKEDGWRPTGLSRRRALL